MVMHRARVGGVEDAIMFRGTAVKAGEGNGAQREKRVVT